MKVLKKFVAIVLLTAAVAALLTGCFPMLGGSQYGAQQTPPPQKEFDGADAFIKAVAAAKADASAPDEAALAALDCYYGLATPPEGYELSGIKASNLVLQAEYAAGPVENDEKYENRMMIGWYRTQKASNYMSEMASNLANQYDVVSEGGVDYIHVTPDVNLAITPSPEDGPEATATTQIVQYCQFVYWVENDLCFMAALPLDFTKEDIGRYCHAEKVPLD